MTQQELIANTRRSLLIYAQRNGVSRACREFGVSRTTFYKVKKQFIKTGSLEPRLRRKPRMPNETSLQKKKLLLRLIQEHPAWGEQRYAHAFGEYGLSVTSSGIGKCLRRFKLNRRYQRLVYVEILRQQNQPLTERTLKAVQRHVAKIQHGLWPGHIIALDTFYVGHLKGVGRIYQITGLDLCSRYGWARLYVSRGTSATCDFVEHHLVPKFFGNGIEPESMLTDNGSEFIGSAFKRLLADYDIRHLRIPPGKPMLNGYCERFQRTILEEFYQPAFRRQYFLALEDLQKALDEYLFYYNFKRPHFGLLRTGAIPVDILKSKTTILRQRFHELLT